MGEATPWRVAAVDWVQATRSAAHRTGDSMDRMTRARGWCAVEPMTLAELVAVAAGRCRLACLGLAPDGGHLPQHLQQPPGESRAVLERRNGAALDAKRVVVARLERESPDLVIEEHPRTTGANADAEALLRDESVAIDPLRCHVHDDRVMVRLRGAAAPDNEHEQARGDRSS